MQTSRYLMATATVLSLAIGPAAMAGSTVYFNSSQHYYTAADSPCASASNFHLENFESGALTLAGVTAIHGHVKGPSSSTDSVDGDDGNVNGSGKTGHSYSSGSSKSITFKFSSGNQGMPTMAGLVWTDGHANSTIVFKAWDKSGNLIGKIKVTLGDLMHSGQTGEDRFLGMASTKGISKIKIASNYAGFEIDHLQFGYGYNFAVVPLPPALGMGVAGLAGLGLWRRRQRKSACQAS